MYCCKHCGKPVEIAIEGELICNACWTRSQQSSESIELDETIEFMTTHCANCERLRGGLQELDWGYCHTCQRENELDLADMRARGEI